jgi:hypothetical protein
MQQFLLGRRARHASWTRRAAPPPTRARSWRRCRRRGRRRRRSSATRSSKRRSQSGHKPTCTLAPPLRPTRSPTAPQLTIHSTPCPAPSSGCLFAYCPLHVALTPCLLLLLRILLLSASRAESSKLRDQLGQAEGQLKAAADRERQLGQKASRPRGSLQSLFGHMHEFPGSRATPRGKQAAVVFAELSGASQQGAVGGASGLGRGASVERPAVGWETVERPAVCPGLGCAQVQQTEAALAEAKREAEAARRELGAAQTQVSQVTQVTQVSQVTQVGPHCAASAASASLPSALLPCHGRLPSTFPLLAPPSLAFTAPVAPVPSPAHNTPPSCIVACLVRAATAFLRCVCSGLVLDVTALSSPLNPAAVGPRVRARLHAARPGLAPPTDRRAQRGAGGAHGAARGGAGGAGGHHPDREALLARAFEWGPLEQRRLALACSHHVGLETQGLTRIVLLPRRAGRPPAGSWRSGPG